MVRKAELEDLPVIAEICNQLHMHHVEINDNYFQRSNADIFFEIIKNDFEHHKETEYLVVESEGMIVAFAEYRIEECKESVLKKHCRKCMIEKFAVCEKNRRNGFGKELIEHIKHLADENLCTAIELGVWYDNYDAVDFYASMGFVPRMYKMSMKI